MSVEPIIGEVGRFLVQSSSDPDMRHLVDVLANECGCKSWVCNHRAHPGFRCRHITAARLHCLETYLEEMRNYQLSK